MKRLAGAFGTLSAALVAVSGAASAQGLDALHAQRVEGGRVCMTDHFHYGSSSGLQNRQVAEREAISSWASFTAWEYGNNWGSWRIAASRKVACSQGASGWGCEVEARPCRPQVGGRRSAAKQ